MKTRTTMLNDEREICDEWEHLAKSRAQQLMTATYELEQMQKRMDAAERKAARYEEISKLGYPELMQKFIDWLATHSTLELGVKPTAKV